jgi:MFS family permease
MSAIVPELVPKEILVAGNSLRALSRQLARVTGPFAGGILVTALGPPGAFGIDAATFVFSFLVFLAAHPPHSSASGKRPLLAAMREGLGFVFSVRWIWITIVGFGFVNAFYLGAFSVGLPLLVRDVLTGGATTFGLIGSTAGFGQLLSSALVANLRLRQLGPTMYACYALTAIAIALYAIPSLPGVLVAAALFSTTLTAANTLWETAVQRNVPRELLGRVTSVDYFGSFLIGPVSPLLAAAISERGGPGAIFLIAGAVSFVFTLAVLALSRSVRELR